MFKEFVSGSLKFSGVDPVTEKKTTVTLNDLAEDAAPAEVEAVRNALMAVVVDPIETTEAVLTYNFV